MWLLDWIKKTKHYHFFLHQHVEIAITWSNFVKVRGIDYEHNSVIANILEEKIALNVSQLTYMLNDAVSYVD